jgi:hypothetical protein
MYFLDELEYLNSCFERKTNFTFDSTLDHKNICVTRAGYAGFYDAHLKVIDVFLSDNWNEVVIRRRCLKEVKYTSFNEMMTKEFISRYKMFHLATSHPFFKCRGR